MSVRKRRSLLAVLTAAVLLLSWGIVTPAAAEPATTVAYSNAASATRYTGLAFDTCTAPTVAQLTAWKASPYRGVGIYIGGANRSCAQPQLTSSWVTTVSRLGWRLIPIYMGPQAPCTFRANAVKISASTAATQGRNAAADAVAKAKALGIVGGSAIYGDMEHYDATNTSCRSAVLTFLSAWTKELHRVGYLSGVYAHLNSGAQHLTQVYNSTSYARPDALWIARWDLSSALTGWSGIPNAYWAVNQRAKQYRGDHNETYGGVTLNIDNDRFDAPVATVAYPYTVTSTTSLNARSAPSTSASVVTSFAPKSTVRVICQTFGSKVGTTTVWNKLTNGAYVTDYYVSTPSNTTYSAPLPYCTLPYQTKAGGLSKRTGPGLSYKIVGSQSIGSLAWITCQRSGSKVGTSSIWDRLVDGTWTIDYYVATPSNTTYSYPIRRC
ncbi:MAG TPA: glycoside hydrolase domain-containing protein [Kribbella sp.]|nr:glycoside hydrolase domain-containing protein [Kribbella sp.]